MRNLIACAGILLLFLSTRLPAQSPISYHLTLDNIHHHELRIAVEFPALSQQVLRVRMPVSSPGRYAEHNFAKNVYSVKAFDGAGRELPVYRASTSEWNVGGHDGFVRFEYTLYGNRGDGTYTGINNRTVHMNMPATFVYGQGMEERPVELHIDLSDHPGWKVATQLKPLDGDSFWAPNYYYFYDSPTIAGTIDWRRWTSTSAGKDYTFEIAMLHEGTAAEFDQYAEWTKRIVEEQKAIFGSLPDYDFGRYTFLCSYNPWIAGDGMEHRNSTVCSAPTSLAENANRLIGTISHEFFHCWNVERIRPKSLEPFDFSRANLSGELWFAEGFTSYFDDLVLCRAGITTPEDYLTGLTGLVNYVMNSPGHHYRGPIGMSYNAPFVDAAAAIDETNFSNTFISYYSYGAFLGLTLDLTLRSRFPEVTLETMMRYLWQHYGQPEVPYTVADLENALAVVTNDAAFARDFFRRYIYGHEMPDLAGLLQTVGVTLAPRNPGQPGFTDWNLNYTDDGAVVRANINENHPLYDAGLNRGDLILRVDEKPVNKEQELDLNFVIGKTHSVTFRQNGLERTGSFRVVADPTLAISVDENATPQAAERRRKWLQSLVKTE